MSRIVQICPVGFEYDRVIEGAFVHSCNHIYLLKSVKRNKGENDPNRRLTEISDMFINKLEDQFDKSKLCKPIVREVNITSLEKIVEELCLIIKEEVEQHETKEIWINVSTSSKLFVPAAMYVGAFYPDIIHLFYLDARHYTVNLLLSKEDLQLDDYIDISKKYKELGISYKENEGSYKNINLPSYTIEILKGYKKNILVMLRKMIGSDLQKMVTFINLLSQLGEDLNQDIKIVKKIKVRYGHHIAYLKKRKWVYEKRHGTQKKYGLTQEGSILSLIYTHLKQELVE